jgi:GR25 family glycosyltransferase involved in LPS biosynthesis
MSLLNEYYQKIVCICLKEREDKYKYAKEQFEKHDIQVEFYRPVISGYAAKFIKPYTDLYNRRNENYVLFNPEFPNEFGALQSHYTVIKSAFLDGVKNLFVFEDDCSFHKDWDILLPKYLDTIPENTDGILLYSFMAQFEPQNIRVKPRWTKGFASWSFVAYGLTRKAMEGYIKLQDETPMIADRGSWTMMTYLGFNFVVASPPLVLPSKTLTSSIRGENKNYEKIKNIFLMGINEKDYE